MKLGMMRWKVEPRKPKPRSWVHSARKLPAVLGTAPSKSPTTTRPAAVPPMLMSRNTLEVTSAWLAMQRTPRLAERPKGLLRDVASPLRPNSEMPAREANVCLLRWAERAGRGPQCAATFMLDIADHSRAVMRAACFASGCADIIFGLSS